MMSSLNFAIRDCCSLISDRDEWQIAVALFEPCDLFGFWFSRQLEPPLPADHAYFVHQ